MVGGGRYYCLFGFSVVFFIVCSEVFLVFLCKVRGESYVGKVVGGEEFVDHICLYLQVTKGVADSVLDDLVSKK